MTILHVLAVIGAMTVMCSAGLLLGLMLKPKSEEKPQRIVGELDGLGIVKVTEQTLAPPSEWIDGLRVHAAFARFNGEQARA